MDYGKAVRIARAIRGISQQDLAESMGVRASYISMIECGKRNNPSLTSLAAALKVPASLLALLGADKRDLRFIGQEEAAALGMALLHTLVGGDGS